MKIFIISALLAFNISIANASDFQDSATLFVHKASIMSTQISEELSLVDRANRSAKFFCNEVVVKLQPELGVSVAGIAGLKFAFSVEYTVSRALPPNLELDKP